MNDVKCPKCESNTILYVERGVVQFYKIAGHEGDKLIVNWDSQDVEYSESDDELECQDCHHSWAWHGEVSGDY